MAKHRKNKAVDPQGSRKEQPQRKKQKREARSGNEDDLDHIPYRLREIMKSKEKMNTRIVKKKKKDSKPRQAADSLQDLTDIPVPKFRRGKWESESSYLRRMDQETHHVMFLTKNQIERHPETDEPSERQKSEKKKEFDKIRLKRLLKKKEEKREQKREEEKFTDKVEFGEVAMEPPSLTAKPKKAPNKAKGGMKGLLLSHLLGSSPVSTAKPSMARQRIMLEERERVVQAYRHLKTLKQERQGSSSTSLDRLQNPH
nr:PREDICTED: coiled-coil domain-containing protein 137 [Lepisosteus oculatus]